MLSYIAKKEGDAMTIHKLLELLRKAENNEFDIWRIKALKDFSDEEIELILSSKNKREVRILLENTDFRSLPKELQKEIIEIIGNSNLNGSVLYYATRIATNKNAINSGYIKEIIEIIVKLENEDIINRVSSIVEDSIATKQKDILKIIQIIIDRPLNKNILIYAELLIKNEFAYRAGNVLEKVKSILNTQNEQEAEKIYTEQVTKGLTISLLESLDEKIIDEVDFWDLIEEGYEMALILLYLEYIPKETLIKELPEVFTEEEYNELINKYFLENIPVSKGFKNIELPSNIKVRRKQESNKR